MCWVRNRAKSDFTKGLDVFELWLGAMHVACIYVQYGVYAEWLITLNKQGMAPVEMFRGVEGTLEDAKHAVVGAWDKYLVELYGHFNNVRGVE